ENVRGLDRAAERTAINGADLFLCESRREIPHLRASLVGQIHADRAGGAVFGRELRRAVAHQEEPRHQGLHHCGVFQPPTSATRRSACAGPQVPGSYSNSGLGPWITGSTMAHAASTTSCRAKSVASPDMAS